MESLTTYLCCGYCSKLMATGIWAIHDAEARHELLSREDNAELTPLCSNCQHLIMPKRIELVPEAASDEL